MIKFRFFIFVTFLWICAIAKNIDDHRTMDNIILVVMYAIFILIGLYELGKDEIEKEKDSEK